MTLIHTRCKQTLRRIVHNQAINKNRMQRKTDKLLYISKCKKIII